MKKIIVVLLVVLCSVTLGCKSSVSLPPPTTSTVTEITEVKRDTIFITQPDQSSLQALLDCQDGKVVIKEIIKEVPGEVILQSPVLNLTDNRLTVDCYAEAQRLFAEWKEQHVNRREEIRVPYPIEKELSGWQIFQIWCGRLFMLLCLLTCVGLIYKLKK